MFKIHKGSVEMSTDAARKRLFHHLFFTLPSPSLQKKEKGIHMKCFLSDSYVNLLALEGRELSRDVLPFLRTSDQALDCRHDGVLVRADLLG